MDRSTGIILGIAAFLVINIGTQLYYSFHSPRCPKASSTGGQKPNCYKPLFVEGESVDMYAYLTTSKKLKWWTPEGLQELQTLPLWNATGLPFGEAASRAELVALPLSDPRLHGVRGNTSGLYLHCFLLRAHASITEAVSTKASEWPEPDRGILSEDILHTRASIIRVQRQMARPRRNLLSAGDEEANGTSGSTRVSVSLPVIGKVAVDPSEGLHWACAYMATTSFVPAGAIIAASRHVVLVGLIPWLTLLQRQQAEMWRKQEEAQRLLEQEARIAAAKEPIVPHLIPQVTVQLSTDFETYDSRYPPPLLYQEITYKGNTPMQRDFRYAVRQSAGQWRYAPPFEIDAWSTQRKHWRPLDANLSKDDPQVSIEVSFGGTVRYSVVKTFQQSIKMYMQMGFTEQDFDDMRDWLFRYPLHIMAIMQLIGFVQMLLTTLAFKNDISFFRGRSDYTGLSSRSLMTDTLHEVVIFLYLYDYEDISRIILYQTGVSSLISCWKFVRVARLGVYWEFLLPWVSFNRGSSAKDEQATEDIDAKGMRYLTWVLYPLSGAWGVYNLYHYSYKSWWSWLVSSLADFAYTFGFINMMPQIFVNYKLKSVAHMPWRVLIYKFFNTFIDDVFAFFIMSDYMTKKHRYMTLRDDIVFFIFLYQRWLYPVDKDRPDEFGFVYKEDEPEGEKLPNEEQALEDKTKDDEDATQKAEPQALSDGDKTAPDTSDSDKPQVQGRPPAVAAEKKEEQGGGAPPTEKENLDANGAEESDGQELRKRR
eukprot:TRINITY_DN49447_c0_g1_i1.p1 TRINITY_DN49447_c0_g1~~TRINITY_DN49447_c0_g1_i1.p1  ORF type:complete len:763 (+),score=145.37 TRINITY_DN49447_c0_g1_i1:113-2401(+)